MTLIGRWCAKHECNYVRGACPQCPGVVAPPTSAPAEASGQVAAPGLDHPRPWRLDVASWGRRIIDSQGGLVTMCDTKEAAKLIIAAVNAYPTEQPPPAPPIEPRDAAGGDGEEEQVALWYESKRHPRAPNWCEFGPLTRAMFVSMCSDAQEAGRSHASAELERLRARVEELEGKNTKLDGELSAVRWDRKLLMQRRDELESESARLAKELEEAQPLLTAIRTLRAKPDDPIAALEVRRVVGEMCAPARGEFIVPNRTYVASCIAETERTIAHLPDGLTRTSMEHHLEMLREELAKIDGVSADDPAKGVG